MINLDYETFIPDIEDLIKKQNHGALLNIMMDLHPADIEEILNRLKKDQRKYLFNLLPTELASEVLSELEAPIIEQVLDGASETKITDLVDEMESDDAADLIAELPDEVAEKVLDQMPTEASLEVQELLHHKEDTAGGLMALEFVSMPATATVNETIERIREMREEINEIYNVWVVDENNGLIGSVSLTELVLGKGDMALQQIMNINVHSVHLAVDQEEVANLFSKYDLVSIPVVNDQKQIVGRITIDDIVDVLEEEGSEDLAFMAGAPDEEILEESPLILSRARLPWLLISFCGEIITALILQSFGATIASFVVAAFFFPLIMAMGGASGQQASVIVIRGLATGDIRMVDTLRRLKKEFKVSFLNSLIFSLMSFIIIFFWESALFASILSSSMFIVINTSNLAGALLPFLFKKLNIDPALASAPFIATANDIFGLLIYLSILTGGLSIFA